MRRHARAPPPSAHYLGGIEYLATLVLQRDRLVRERDEALARELKLQDTAQRMDEFLATAGHDLRSPLTAVVGTIDLAAVRFGRLVDMLTDLPWAQRSPGRSIVSASACRMLLTARNALPNWSNFCSTRHRRAPAPSSCDARDVIW